MAVFDHFFDDAAVFPPGLATVARAVAEHDARRGDDVEPFMGPLVVPAAALETVLDVERRGEPLAVSVVGDPASVRRAVEALSDGASITVASLELKDVDDLEKAAELASFTGAPVYVELSADAANDGHALARLGELGLRAKFRTGGITADLYPSPQTVAEFIVNAVAADVAFKFTAGLHRALRYTNTSTGVTHFGFLNLAEATRLARAGSSLEAVRATIEADDLTGVSGALEDASWRESFTSFGTCSTTEPLMSLADLGVIPVALATSSQEKTMPIENEKSAAQTYATAGFGLANLPYGSYRVGGGEPRLGVRLGSQVLDAGAIAKAAGRDDLLAVLDTANLDALLAAGHETWHAVRAFLQEFLASDASRNLPEGSVNTVEAVEMLLPFTPADYVDFYASQHHATNVGHIFRPDQEPLLPNWHHLPIGYHGRSSTLYVSGTDVVRPKGLRPTKPGGAPSFGECLRLDIEAEMGFVVGGSAPEGEVSLDEADEFIFGLVLVNDWSARDIQAFEYVPLGPFLGKSFATSLGAWVVPLEALDAARTRTPERVKELAPYLDDSSTREWNFAIDLEVEVNGEVVSRPPFAQMYFSGAQMLAHMSVNGAAVTTGDFFASGTISGPEKNQRGSFLELSWGGEEPLTLADGSQMTFLEDGQEITITATAPGADGEIIDFGAVTGRITPAT